MKIDDPDVYQGKLVKVYSTDGGITVGDFLGYNYDYDDEGNELVEFDVDETKTGYCIGFSENEVERMEIIS
jgi:hypothetical protein